MAKHPEEAEVCVGYALKHPFEIELHIRLALETGVIPQDEQLQAIRKECP